MSSVTSTESSMHTQYTASIISRIVCTYNARIMHTYIAVYTVPCGEISRAVFIGMSWQKHAETYLCIAVVLSKIHHTIHLSLFNILHTLN